MAETTKPGFGIYIHWPFCAAKCPYCDFNSHVRQSTDHQRWRKALVKDLRAQATQVERQTVTSIFFGGGTPSLMKPQTVAELLDEIAYLFDCDDRLEVTLEANPTSVEVEKFSGFQKAGVNRISMGIQALDDGDLKRLGRLHTASEAIDAFEIARGLFDQVSFDLIYARQNQSVSDWHAELRMALDMAVDHLSLYQLTIEPNTRFGDLYAKNRLRGLPDDDVATDMFQLTQDVCLDYGLPSYEVSNHARAGAECRHNLVYWRYGDYLGVGPGAHGRLSRDYQKYATETHSLPETWITQVEETGTGISKSTSLDGPQQGQEYLLMSLRLSEGSDLKRYESLSGSPVNSAALQELADGGFLQRSGDRIRATRKGQLVLNEVLRLLLQ